MDIKQEQLNGGFLRQEDVFRKWISNEKTSEFPAIPNRYHLYVSLACPWAHRTVIVRKLLGLENIISMTVVDPVRDHRGWKFGNGNGFEKDSIENFKYLSEAYRATDVNWRGRTTVPVLWDKKTHKIVNNSEDDICKIFNNISRNSSSKPIDLFPQEFSESAGKLNAMIYTDINNGIYQAGFAKTQEVHEHWVRRLFSAFEEIEGRLSQIRFLFGNRLTESDLRLFCSLVRFDAVYYVHFKCNIRRVTDYPNLWGFTRDVYQYEGIAETVNLNHIKKHYYKTHPEINPTRFVPLGPQIDFTIPHGREKNNGGRAI